MGGAGLELATRAGSLATSSGSAASVSKSTRVFGARHSPSSSHSSTSSGDSEKSISSSGIRGSSACGLKKLTRCAEGEDISARFNSED
jgi:hypothetical protein